MEIEAIFEWISNQGFAIAIASFLILRLEGKLVEIKDEIQKLRSEIQNNP
jgi:hypothetical protein